MAQHTRKLENGHYVGGPVYYIKYVFKGRFGKFLAGFFSVAIILALGFMGNMVQSNSIGAAFNNAFHVPKLAVGICVAVIAASSSLAVSRESQASQKKSFRSWRCYTSSDAL